MLTVRSETSENAGSVRADPQATQLYAWEKAWRGWNKSNLTSTECREAARRACVYLKVPPVTVVFHCNPRYSWVNEGETVIHINAKRHKNLITILHEVAHHAVWFKHQARAETHGKEFVRVYLRLLLRARIAPHIALVSSLEAYGVSW